MKKIIAVFVMFVMVNTLQAQKHKSIPKDLIVYDMEGNPKKMGEIMKNNGVPIIVDFWATWCRPCLEELDNVNELYPQWRKENKAKMILISIDNPDKIEKINKLAKRNKWQFELYIDRDNKAQKALGVTQIPNTFVVDEEGKILHHEEGYLEGDEKIIIRKVKKYSIK